MESGKLFQPEHYNVAKECLLFTLLIITMENLQMKTIR